MLVNVVHKIAGEPGQEITNIVAVLSDDEKTATLVKVLGSEYTSVCFELDEISQLYIDLAAKKGISML